MNRTPNYIVVSNIKDIGLHLVSKAFLLAEELGAIVVDRSSAHINARGLKIAIVGHGHPSLHAGESLLSSIHEPKAHKITRIHIPEIAWQAKPKKVHPKHQKHNKHNKFHN